jgi:cyclopropane-fatty-acyl-phospholipid synthase
MKVIDQWDVNGTHYSKTLEAWLQRLDRNQRPAKKVRM